MTKETADSLVTNEVHKALQEIVEKRIKELTPIIEAAVDKVFKSKFFQKDIDIFVTNSITDYLDDNSLEDTIGSKKFSDLISKAVKSIIK